MTSNRFIPVTVPTTNLLSEEIEFRNDGKGNSLRNIDYYRDCALLVELANGFYGKNGSGYAFPALRQSIHNYRDKGEWTADHVDFDVPASTGIVPAGYARANWIQHADKISKKGEMYHAEGGVVTPIELPPDGWQVPNSKRMLFHHVTGSPLQTVPRDRKQEAIKMLKDTGYDENDLSYFYKVGNGLRAVLRSFGLHGYGSFYVGADYVPDNGYSGVGGRVCRRSEPLRSKGDARKIVVGISPEEYRQFIRLKEFYEKLDEEFRSLQE